MLHQGHADKAVEMVRDAVDTALNVGARDLIPRFRLGILLTHHSAGRPRDGVALINLANGTGWIEEPISADNFMSRGFYGFMLCWMGRMAEGETHMLPAVEFSERDGRAASWMYANLVDHAWFTGREALAMQHARRAVEAAQAFGSPFFSTVSARAMARALGMQAQHKQAVELLEPLRPVVAPGGLAHQFEANFLAQLSESYLGCGRVEDAARAAHDSVASAQRSGSRMWEIVGWLALLSLPREGAWSARVPEGLARCEELIVSSGSEGLRPHLMLARAHWARNGGERAQQLRAAIDEFGRQGLHEQVRRWQHKEQIAA
jgi:adenylate cyclase